MKDADMRVSWIQEELRASGLDALVCTLPENVLMLTGYWPVVGTAVAVATPDQIAVLAPEDEHELAERGWAEVRTYQPGSLTQITGPGEAVSEPLGTLLNDLGVGRGRLGYDDADIYEGASYAALHLFRTGIRDVLATAAPRASVASGSTSVSRLRTALSATEVDWVRLACEIAGAIFRDAAGDIRPGLREPDVAASFQGPLVGRGLAQSNAARAGGFVWCMSGPNSALAGAAYAQTRNRQLEHGDLVLVHCNSYLDGYWTDITRTYCLGRPHARQREMYDAIFAARAAALAAIRPGVRAADVDAAARGVLTERGFGQYFTHGIGHNVGFSVISMDFPPRLHPASPDYLEVGMTFNIEPAIYISGYGGIRHCDVVTVREEGAEVLTTFQPDVEELTLA